MGKKAKLKQIRKLASQMPVINTKAIQGERVTGEYLIQNGVTEVEGKPVSPFGQYRERKVIEKPLNHNRKMKDLFNKYGAAGVRMYIGAVNKHMAGHSNAESA